VLRLGRRWLLHGLPLTMGMGVGGSCKVSVPIISATQREPSNARSPSITPPVAQENFWVFGPGGRVFAIQFKHEGDPLYRRVLGGGLGLGAAAV